MRWLSCLYRVLYLKMQNLKIVEIGTETPQTSWSSLDIEGILSPSRPFSPPLSVSSPIAQSPLALPPIFPTSPPVSLIPPSTPPSHPTQPLLHPPPLPEISRNVLKRKIQKGVQERVNDFWKGRVGRYVMQGDYLALLMEEGDSITWKSYLWDIPQGVLKFALNAGVNTLPSLDNLKRWGKRVSDRCPFCGNIGTLAHVLSNCTTALSQGRYTWRHNSVLCSLIELIRPYLKEGMTLYSDMPGYQAPHGGTVPPHVLVTALKPDIVIISSLSEEVIIFELTCPWERNITRSHNFKSEKYAPLITDLSQNKVVSFYPIEVSARGQVTKDNRSRLKSFLIKCCNPPRATSKSLIRVSSKAALLASYSIFSARAEPTWEDPAPLVVH